MLGRDEDDVMSAFVEDRHVRDIKRLGINVAVHRVREQSPEGRGIDIRKRQNGFIRVLSGARVVVVLRPDADLRRRCVREQTAAEKNGQHQATSCPVKATKEMFPEKDTVDSHTGFDGL